MSLILRDLYSLVCRRVHVEICPVYGSSPFFSSYACLPSWSAVLFPRYTTPHPYWKSGARVWWKASVTAVPVDCTSKSQFVGGNLHGNRHQCFYSPPIHCIENYPGTSTIQDLSHEEKAKLALANWLGQLDGVSKDLAHNIAQNAPIYVNKLVEKQLAIENEASFDSKTNFKAEVEKFLSTSRCKGIEPYLESIGFNQRVISKVIGYARSGLCGPNSVTAKVKFLLNIGVPQEEVPRLMSSNPRILSNAVETQQLKVKFLADMGIPAHRICQLIITYPKLLSFSLQNGSHKILEFLRSFGVKESDFGKVVQRCPQLLTLSVENKLKPAIEILEGIGITGPRLAQVLVTQPSLLRRRLQRNVAFCSGFDLNLKPEVIARLLITCPSFSIEGCEARVKYLESVGLSKTQVLAMISRNPAFLSINVENSLAPKVDYLTKVMGRSISELVAAPTFLTMSLEGRIKPRHRVLSALLKLGLVKRPYSLNAMVCWTNEYFFERFVQNTSSEVRDLWIDVPSRLSSSNFKVVEDGLKCKTIVALVSPDLTNSKADHAQEHADGLDI